MRNPGMGYVWYLATAHPAHCCMYKRVRVTSLTQAPNKIFHMELVGTNCLCPPLNPFQLSPDNRLEHSLGVTAGERDIHV